MKLGIVIYSSEAETLWNAFRLGVFALKAGDTVKAFLLGKGVECGKYDADPFNVQSQMEAFVNGGGVILACGTCLKLRNSQGSELCPLSTLKDLYEMIQDCDKALAF